MSRRVLIDEKTVFTKLDESHAALLHLESKRYYDLKETGVRIWELLESQLALDELVGQLTREYDVEADVARASVERLVAELESEGLVRTVEP